MKIDQAKIKSPTEKLEAIRQRSSTGLVNAFNDDKKGEFYYIEMDKLIPYHKQARKSFDEEKIRNLALTIEKHGIRQPLTVIKSQKEPHKYEIISGERRFRAAQLLSLAKVPCIILSESSHAEEISLIENIQREDLHPIELGIAYADLAQKKSLSLNKLADSLGVANSTLKEHVQYANLEEDIKHLLINHQIKERSILRKVMTLKSQEERKKFVNAEISKRISNKGKSYSARKVALFSAHILEGKLSFELKKLNRLSESQKTEIKNFINSILETI